MTSGQEPFYPTVKQPKFFYGYIVVAAATLILFASQSMRYAFGVFFNPLLTEFGWNRAMTSGAFSLGALMESISAINMGALTDRLGPRKVIAICGLLIGVGYFLVSRIDSVWQFYLIYGMLIGVGMGGTVVPSLPTISRWFIKNRNNMTAIVMCGMSIGVAVGPLLADSLIYTYNWRTAYAVISIITLVFLVGSAQLIRRDPAQMGLTAYGAEQNPSQPPQPVIEGKSLKQILATPAFWQVVIMAFCLGLVTTAASVHLVPNAIDHGIAPTAAARIMSIMGITMTIGRLSVISTADKIGIRKVFIISTSLIAASFIELALAQETWMFYLFVIVLGMAEGLSSTLFIPALAGVFGLKSIGLLSGFNGLAITLGSSVGPYMAGYLFDTMGNYQIAFLLCAGVAVIGLISAITFNPHKVKRD